LACVSKGNTADSTDSARTSTLEGQAGSFVAIDQAGISTVYKQAVGGATTAASAAAAMAASAAVCPCATLGCTEHDVLACSILTSKATSTTFTANATRSSITTMATLAWEND
jgi:hypothetical protein